MKTAMPVRRPWVVGSYALASQLLLFTVVYTAMAAPPKPSVTLPSQSPKTYDVYDFIVTNVPVVDTPFNPRCIMLDASITTPAGKVMKLPGYPNHDVRGGPWVWHVRYAPPLAGNYTGTVTVTMPDGATSSDQFSFAATQSSAKGMIHVAKANPTMLEFDNGTAYIPVGENLFNTNRTGSQTAWYTTRLDGMAKYGGNWIRHWACLYWLGTEYIEGPHPYAFADDHASILDTVLMLCQARGIYAMVNLELVRTIMQTEYQGSWPGNPTFPYAKQNGGPCSTDEEFFTLPEAQDMYKARLRYVIARFAAYSSFYGFEFWNEIGNLDAALDANISRPWHDMMAQYCHANDPYNHLVSTEFAYAYGLKSFDVLNLHVYQGGGQPIGPGFVVGLGISEKAMPGYYNDISSYNQPFLFAECGLVNDNWGRSPYYDSDPDGYAIHEEIWYPFFSVSSGSAMDYWWETIQSKNYYKHYQPFASFVSDLPVNKSTFPKVTATTTVANLTPFARSGTWGTAAWFWDKTANWETMVINKGTPRTISGGSATIPVPSAGVYSMIIMNTFTGDTLAKGDVTTTGTSVTIPLPTFKIDVAIKLLNKSWVPVGVTSDRPAQRSRKSINIAGSTVRTMSLMPTTIEVFDARGVKVLGQRVAAGSTRAPLRLAAGYYVVRSISADKKAIQQGAVVGR